MSSDNIVANFNKKDRRECRGLSATAQNLRDLLPGRRRRLRVRLSRRGRCRRWLGDARIQLADPAGEIGRRVLELGNVRWSRCRQLAESPCRSACSLW